jgi:enoyl-CoA hydratase
MKNGCVHLDINGPVAYVSFDSPASHNAMTWVMYEQLAVICEQLALHQTVRVVIFKGVGGEAFVAGTDISQFQEFRGEDDGVAYEHYIDQAIALIESLPMATIAVIEGCAIGGGLAISTACDFRVATAALRLGVPIAKTLGNTLSMANLARLQTAFGNQRVKRMLMLAEVLNAEEALACGFLHRVCLPAELDEVVAGLCDQLLALAPVTQSAVKEGLRRLVDDQLPDGEDLIRRCYGSQDFREGVNAFVAKRAPVWVGI